MARGEETRDADGSRPKLQWTVEDAEEDLREWYRLRDAARDYFATVPPYRITFNDDGRCSLERKYYEFWPEREAQEVVHWQQLSRHDNLEEAERRLRHVTSPTVYYDERGRQVPGPPDPPLDFGIPDDEGPDEPEEE